MDRGKRGAPAPHGAVQNDDNGCVWLIADPESTLGKLFTHMLSSSKVVKHCI